MLFHWDAEKLSASTAIIKNTVDGGGRSKYVSQRWYYAFRLQRRPGEPPALLMGGRLLQQYVVDALGFYRAE